MDIMQQELLRKNQGKPEKTGGKKWYNRAEVEKQRLQKIREEEKQEAKAKSLPQKQNGNPNPDPSKSKNDTASSPSKTPADEQKNLPREDVMRRLRFIKQPATLFGEDDQLRRERLRFEMNDVSDLTKKRQKRKKEDNDDDERDSKRMNANFEDLCDEDKILVFFKKLLMEWNREIGEMPEAEKRTAQGKSKAATSKQCALNLNPLFNLCRSKLLHDDIRKALMLSVDGCMQRDYTATKNHYFRMSIGNSPWPIGVTMVGIHERSAREKIHANSVAHIMNDETTRKYLQSVKRLITFCEDRYPPVPSGSCLTVSSFL